jgi:hypothetical protein
MDNSIIYIIIKFIVTTAIIVLSLTKSKKKPKSVMDELNANPDFHQKN